MFMEVNVRIFLSVTFLECHGVKSKFCTAFRTFHNVFVVTDNYAINIYQ